MTRWQMKTSQITTVDLQTISQDYTSRLIGCTKLLRARTICWNGLTALQMSWVFSQMWHLGNIFFTIVTLPGQTPLKPQSHVMFRGEMQCKRFNSANFHAMLHHAPRQGIQRSLSSSYQCVGCNPSTPLASLLLTLFVCATVIYQAASRCCCTFNCRYASEEPLNDDKVEAICNLCVRSYVFG